MKIPKEIIRDYVKNESFTNTMGIMDSIKNMVTIHSPRKV